MILTLSVFACAQVFALTIDQKETIEQLLEPATSTFIDTLLEIYDPIEEIDAYITQVNIKLEQNNLSDSTIYGLEYVRRALQQAQETILTTETPESLPDLPSIDVSTYFDGKKSILAGEASLAIIELEYTAQLEDILIQDIEIYNSDLWITIETVRIYSETGLFLGAFSPLSHTYTMKNVNLYIPQGTSKFYITLQPYRIGQDTIGRQSHNKFYKFTVTKAIWQTTKETINSYHISNTSDPISTLPVKIDTISFLDEAFGHRIATHLRDGNNKLAIIEIKADTRINWFKEHAHSLWLVLDTLTLSIGDGTKEQDISSRLTIKRIDSGDHTPLGESSSTSESSTFDFDWADDSVRLLDSGETAVYLIEGDLDLDNNIPEYVNISFNDLDDWSIVYSSEDIETSSITALHFESDYLQNESIHD